MLTLHTQVMITRALIHKGNSFQEKDSVRIGQFIAYLGRWHGESDLISIENDVNIS